MISKDTTIEDIIEKVPGAIAYLMDQKIRCIRCGEPIWGSLEEAAVEKGYSDDQIKKFVKDLNDILNKEK